MNHYLRVLSIFKNGFLFFAVMGYSLGTLLISASASAAALELTDSTLLTCRHLFMVFRS